MGRRGRVACFAPGTVILPLSVVLAAAGGAVERAAAQVDCDDGQRVPGSGTSDVVANWDALALWDDRAIHAVSGAASPYDLAKDPGTGAWAIERNLPPEAQSGVISVWENRLAVIQGDNRVRIFERDPATGNWSEGPSIRHPNDPLEQIHPTCVSLWRERAATSGQDFVRLFERDPGTGQWTLTDVVEKPECDPAVHSGACNFYRCELLGDRFLEGRPEGSHDPDDSQRGAAVVYARDPGTGVWQQEAMLESFSVRPPPPWGRWGNHVALGPDIALVGASWSYDGGAELFVRSAVTGQWEGRIRLRAPEDENAVDRWTTSVDLDGNLAVVGHAVFTRERCGDLVDEPPYGCDYVADLYWFAVDTGASGRLRRFRPSVEPDRGAFGSTVQVSPSTVAVAARYETDAGVRTGAVHFFDCSLQDGDADGAPDDVDCAPADAGLWSAPGENTGLVVKKQPATGEIRLDWRAGGAGGTGGVTQQAMAGELEAMRAGDLTSGATCVWSGVATSSDPFLPAGGDRWYLTRATNACGPGAVAPDPGGPRDDLNAAATDPCP